MPMLDRTVMDIIKMTLKIVFRFKRVFPEPPLPDAASALALPTSAERLFDAA